MKVLHQIIFDFFGEKKKLFWLRANRSMQRPMKKQVEARTEKLRSCKVCQIVYGIFYLGKFYLKLFRFSNFILSKINAMKQFRWNCKNLLGVWLWSFHLYHKSFYKVGYYIKVIWLNELISYINNKIVNYCYPKICLYHISILISAFM